MSAQALVDLAEQLIPRDWSILTDLKRFGFLTSRQLQTLHFPDHRSDAVAARLCRRALQRLADHRLVARAAQRRGGFLAGSSPVVWRLDVAGDRLLRRGTDAPRDRFKLPSIRFLDHRLAAADCYVDLVMLSRTSGIEIVAMQTEPDTWRSYLGIGGGPEILKPDLYAVTASGDYEDHWFIEVDRATESVPTVLKKCRQYERYRRTGREQQQAGLFPVIVWTVPDELRAAQLQRAFASSGEIDAALYRVVVSTQFADLIRGGAA